MQFGYAFEVVLVLPDPLTQEQRDELMMNLQNAADQSRRVIVGKGHDEVSLAKVRPTIGWPGEYVSEKVGSQ